MSQLPHVLSSQDESLDLEKVSTAHKEELNTKEPHSQANSLDWDGPEDTDNPKTWSLKKRIFHSVIPGLFNFVVSLGTSIYTPGVPQISKDFHVTPTVALLGLSVYSLGLGLGPIIGAPISETQGRKAVYVLTLPLSLLFTLGAGLAQNFETLLVCRFLSGAFGSPALAVGAGTIADIWVLEEGGGLATVLVILAPFMGPALGPLIGGYTVLRRSWEWLMWALLIVGLPIYLLTFLTSETYKKVILARRAKSRGIPVPPGPTGVQAAKVLLTITLIRPLHMLVTEPIVGFISLYAAFSFGVLFAFFASFPYVFGAVYGFDSGSVGLAFLGLLFGLFLAVGTFAVFDRTWYAAAREKAKLEGKATEPEHRLYASMAGSLGIPISLFWFAWSAKRDVHWIVPILAGIPFGWGNLCLFLGTTTYLVDVYHALNGASAMAANGLLRYTFGAVFPLFTVQMYRGLGIPWAGSLLGFFSLLLLPIPWVLFRWGDKIRQRSSYPTGQNITR
ncbi:MFS general substrate transporter [Morchella conica CCBAS932]|uniref:MFS general substrate transporter n=1 Tax=Morchella conica CCBAS932 TaxID=1392247 RepID=A0A3N4L2U8_9PEZI|nr:MFS general substrate transporter [Morchella conica CCBAS932]